ncbi:MAG: hypothetical protein HQL39_00160 [Alphaproteobacteria bacterium]|nr:hypothetical protein [Alphaproteobacteria bacterium]
MKRLLTDKRAYFAAFGAVGGLLSALTYGLTGFEDAFASWVVGTGFDGMLVAALLAFGQARYVGKAFDWKAFRKAMLIGGVGGVVGGLAALAGLPIAQAFGGESDAGRFLGWTFGGIAVGFAVSKVVPNLKLKTACAAGAAGGFIGCGLMYLISELAAGTATTGAAIGLAIAYAETAFRQAWLEVTIRPKGLSLDKERTISVTLGDRPVVFGCAGDADVKLAEMVGTKAHFAKVSLLDGKVTLLDMTTEKSRDIAVDEAFDVSNAHVIVRSKPALTVSA